MPSGRDVFDLCVVGGGINGTGIARDAAGRGLGVLLCERGDLAAGTSSASTKLIHGGLRYLEHYAFRLVRESLVEREVLLDAAPHIIRPMQFVLPHNEGQRPAWMIRLGLMLYDNLGGRKRLPASRSVDLATHIAGKPLRPGFSRGFVYSDCWVHDSRLVVLNAMDARDRGAEILTRTELMDARREGALWVVTLRADDGREWEERARALVNAAGPWAGSLLGSRIEDDREAPLRLVKGSHIVVPRLFEHDYAYIFQNPDRRIVFAIPFETDFTLIGTTDEDFAGSLDDIAISERETGYLCDSVNAYFDRQIGAGDVVWSYSGVRPLYDDDAETASEATRDYVLDLEAPGGAAPLLNVFGGKLTTYRRLAEQVMDRLAPLLRADRKSWTAGVPLPGGDVPGADMDRFLAGIRSRHPWLPEAMSARLAECYGTRADAVLGEAGGLTDLGEDFGGGFTAAEASYLMAEEWARTAEDMLWRRTKLGLRTDPGTAAALTRWIESGPAEAPAATGSAG